MLRYWIVMAVALGTLKSSYCQTNAGYFQPAPFPYIHAADSVVLYLYRGQLTRDHFIERGQTLYSITKYYGVPLDLLRTFNPELLPGGALQIGRSIRVPIPPNAIRPQCGAEHGASCAPCWYKVSPGETLYGIARRVFRSSTAQFAEMNQLQSVDLHPGQLLRVGWLDTRGISPSMRSKALAQRREEARAQGRLDSSFIKEDMTLREDKNLAFWNKGTQQKGLFVIHKYISPGIIVDIYNPNMNISVKAKVVGNILPGTYPTDIDMIVTSEVADQLGAIDPRFYVKVHYYK